MSPAPVEGVAPLDADPAEAGPLGEDVLGADGGEPRLHQAGLRARQQRRPRGRQADARDASLPRTAGAPMVSTTGWESQSQFTKTKSV